MRKNIMKMGTMALIGKNIFYYRNKLSKLISVIVKRSTFSYEN